MKKIGLVLTALLINFVGLAQYDTVYAEKNGYSGAWIKGKVGFLDANRVLVVPVMYKNAYNFSKTGIAAAQNDNGKWGAINGKNEIIIPFKYLKLITYDFSVCKTMNADSLWALCDPTGKEITPSIYTWLSKPNSKGNFIAEKDGKRGLISSTGKELVAFDYVNFFDASHGFHWAITRTRNDKAYGNYISEDGEQIGSLFMNGRNFTADGIAGCYAFSGEFGYINTKGEDVVPPTLLAGADFKNGKAIVITLENEIGYVDVQGKFTKIEGKIPYDLVADKWKYKNYRVAMLLDHAGVTDVDGNNIIPPIYNNFNDLNHDLFTVKKGEFWGVLSLNGKEIVPFVYDGIGEIQEGPQGNMFYIRKDAVYGLMKTDGTVILKPTYKEIGEYANNFYRFDGPGGADVYVNARGDKFTKPMYDEYVKQIAAKTQSADYAQESAVQNIQSIYDKIQEKEEKENAPEIKKNLIHTSDLTPPALIGTTEKMYNLTSVDTLYYKNLNNKMLAIKRVGNSFVVLGTVVETITEHYAKLAGFSLDKLNLSGSSHEYAKGPSYVPANWVGNFEGMSYNTFEQTNGNFLVCSPLGFTIFSPDGKVVDHNYNLKYRLISAVTVPNSNEIVLLGVYGSEPGLGIFTYNMDTKAFGSVVPINSLSISRMYLAPVSTKLLYTPDNQIMLTMCHNEGQDGLRASNQYIAKLSLDKIREGNKDIFLWWGQFDYYKIRHAEIKPDGKLTGILADNASMIYFEGNPLAKSFDEFDRSLTMITTSDKHQTTGINSLVFPIQNNEWITVSNGNYQDGYDASLAICHFNSKMQLIRQYRIPNPFEDFPERKYFTCYGNQYGLIARVDDEVYSRYGISSRKYSDLLTNANNYHSHEMEYGIYHVIPGSKPGEIIMMTGTTVMKIDLTKYVECGLKQKLQDWSSSGSDASNDTDYSSGGTNASNGSSSNKGTAASKPSASNKCTIINDLKPDQQTKYGDVKLVFRNYQIVTKSISRTHTFEVDCDDVIVYKQLRENSSDPGEKLFETKGKCGQTIKLSDYW